MVYIVVLFAIMFLAFVIYNVYSNFKQEQDIERRKKIAHYKEIINDADELLLNANHIPYTKNLILVLQNRILVALSNILECNPQLNSIKSRIGDIKQQIEYVKTNYQAGEDNPFIVPNNDRQAVQMLKQIKRLRKIVRIEHNKGKLDPKTFSSEDRRLELLLIKINIASLLTHVKDAQVARQWGTCKELITKAMAVLRNIPDKDNWLESHTEELENIDHAINIELQEMNKKEMKNIEDKDKHDLDQLFSPKKKW